MREFYNLTVYESFKELVENWDFSYWRTTEEGIVKEYVTIADFLDQPNMFYFEFEAEYPLTTEPTTAYWCMFNGVHFVVLNPADDISGFWVVYCEGRCRGTAFFTIDEAEAYIYRYL